MQQELDAAGLPVPVVILGVNGVGFETGNAAVTADRDIPWLQDMASVDVWSTWDVTYRDVVILDEENEPYAVFNLSLHDLGDPSEYAALMALFEAAATD